MFIGLPRLTKRKIAIIIAFIVGIVFSAFAIAGVFKPESTSTPTSAPITLITSGDITSPSGLRYLGNVNKIDITINFASISYDNPKTLL